MIRIASSVLVLGVAIGGCSTVNYTASELANTKGQMVSAALLKPGKDANVYSGVAEELLAEYTNRNTLRRGSVKSPSGSVGRSLFDALSGEKAFCSSPYDTQTDAALIPIISAAVKLVYDIQSDRTNRRLENIKKSSSSAYSSEFVLEKGAIESYKCLILIRHNAKADESGKFDVNAVVAFRISSKSETFNISPAFYWARNTVANTRAVKSGERESIAFMAGMSLQGIGKQENGVEVIASSGQDVEKLGKFSLRGEYVGEIVNELIIGPVPLIRNSPITILRITVTEIGDVGFNVDERLAVNKTIRESVGPALSAGAKAYLED